eukprot:6868-Heterococcus_DN1.PRE.2
MNNSQEPAAEENAATCTPEHRNVQLLEIHLTVAHAAKLDAASSTQRSATSTVAIASQSNTQHACADDRLVLRHFHFASVSVNHSRILSYETAYHH